MTKGRDACIMTKGRDACIMTKGRDDKPTTIDEEACNSCVPLHPLPQKKKTDQAKPDLSKIILAKN